MKPFYLSILILSSLLAATANAQTHSDCDNPLLLSNTESVTILTTSGEGNVADDLAGTCMGQEFSSTWLSWQIEQPGTLTFVLTPLQEGDDLDFAVFRFNDNILCQEKILKRCMAAGENVGAPMSANAPCLGPTGLNMTETDFEEQPGCNNGNNNFLKFLEVKAGENYALVVNNFNLTGEGFTLEWGGTATFSPVPDSINSPTLEAKGLHLSIGPNPTNGTFQVFGLENSNDVQYRIFDSLGRLMKAGKLQAGSRSVDVSALPSGVYFMNITMNEDLRQLFKVVLE